MQKLIIIRGPSGSGKSSVSKAIYERSPRPTLLISEDKVRRMFSDWKEPDHTASKQLATMAVKHGLNSGYDVVYEGIANIKTYKTYFDEILASHPDENYFFYLDVPFGETARRHESRPEKSEFDVEMMKVWWDYASPTKYEHETIIPEHSSLHETVETIGRVAGLNLEKKLGSSLFVIEQI